MYKYDPIIILDWIQFDILQKNFFLGSSKSELASYFISDLKIYYLKLHTIDISVHIYYYLYATTYICAYILREIYVMWPDN